MITITFDVWLIPAAITAIGLIWALFIVDDSGGMFSGISNILALVPVLAVSCIAWMVYAVFK
jgi:hypothetical protein